MATLELEINCLCLFVPDPAEKVVHVLMPATNGHESGHGNGHEGHGKHVVRMLHRSFGPNEDVGRSMEGWALTLGPKTASADRTLLPEEGEPDEVGEIPNLGTVTGRTLDSTLLGPNPGARVAARVTLRSGRVKRLLYESRWRIENKALGIKLEDVRIAHRVVWTMSGVDPRLSWKALVGGSNGNSPPLERLDDLEPEDDLSYTLRIFHVTEDALPPKGGILAPSEMRQHYRALYALLGETSPADELLPRIREKHVVDVNCGPGQAKPTGG